MNDAAVKNLRKLWRVNLNDNECIHGDFYGADKIAALAKVLDENCGYFLPLFSNCGQVKAAVGEIEGNGTETARGEWPFLAALFNTETEKFFCSGTLITQRHILTSENFNQQTSP